MSQFNRRDFLRTVGATSGARAMFATMGALGFAPTAQAAARDAKYVAPTTGDWLSYADAWQHGAFTSARKAVAALHKRVLA